ncbi:MAG: ABC transporter ATP-binding protein/permease [Ruminococcus sp.]|nr:ABC transporter ATP-binding protein/permease [Ruminococcus sp.]
MIKLFKHLQFNGLLMIVVCLCFIAIQGWLDLKIPDKMSEITMYVQTEGSEMSEILKSGGWMLFYAFGSLLAAFIISLISARISSDFSSTIRQKLFYKIQSFSISEINDFSMPSLITRSTNDVTQIQTMLLMGIQVIFKAPIIAGIALYKIIGKSKEWSFTTGVAVLLLLLIVVLCVCLTIKKFKRIQFLTDDMNRITRENINGVQVLRAYNAEKYREKSFDKINVDITNTNIYTSVVMAFLNPSISMVMNGLSLAIYWVGASLINESVGDDRFGLFSDMVVYSSYAMQIVSAFMMLVMVFMILPRAVVSGKRITEVLNKKIAVRDGNDFKTPNGSFVEFRDVSFKYPGAEDNVVSNISFRADKGETVAFIGSTGCGKTTIMNLIMRFFDATEGEVIIDGINVKDYSLKLLHEKIGYVPQNSFIFSGTIASNIAYGPYESIDNEVINEAANIAYVSDFLDELNEGIQSIVNREGTNFSGGQKQRISIARAIYKKPKILIFDDSFSALDYKTDQLVRTMLNEKYKDSIKLIVAQRVGTIIEADKIVVLDNGRIDGIGTHDQLLNNSDVYRQIVATQIQGGDEE